MDATTFPRQTQTAYLKSGSLIMLMSLLFGFAADYGFNLVLSRVLSPHAYGDYKVAYAFAVLSSVVILLGGDRIAPRMLSAAIVKNETGYIFSFVRFYVCLSLMLSVILILATYLGGLLHLGTTDPEAHHPMLLMSFFIPVIACGALLSRVLQSAKLLALSNLPWRVALPLLKMAAIAVLLFVMQEVQLWQVIVSGGIVATAIALWQWRKTQSLGLLIYHPDISALKEKRQLLSLSVPMMLAMLITMALNQIDLLMLEALAEEHQVGYFAAAATTAHLLPVAQVTIAGIFLPLFGTAMESSLDQAKVLFWQAQKIILGVIITLALAGFAGGDRLLSFFGPDFLAAEPALYWLIGAYALWGVSGLASTWLQYTNRGQDVVVIGLIALITDAGLNVWLIPAYGIQGAAIATFVSMLMAGACVWYRFFSPVTTDLVTTE
ncbi:oligosaccharide flippase family protein [Photobacterium sp. GJ3]|uniref:oligosaccharide flippase family protein n=1 Tax=Photobacterium sp. GJ3 TaxID=2829502 RepID=UPI001B8CAE4E|nr:oligosaccharide flippase family protein [Photobacterium sp. GJ3]QUJ68895.1 oligosaccharide flippase family protein [Photobacterium sp. GJ3]